MYPRTIALHRQQRVTKRVDSIVLKDVAVTL
jgi:hypothetical protein